MQTARTAVGGEDLLGDKKALVGLGEEHRVPSHIIIIVIVISSCTAPEADKVIDRVMHDWQHRAISNVVSPLLVQ